jgi:hypothetical protein
MSRATSIRVLLFSALTSLLWLVAAQSTAPAPTGRWYKGNLHTHTVNSDGDSSPDEVVRWYKEHRYDFLVLTDHNYFTAVDGLNAVFAADDKFLVVRGEEVTDRFGDKPIHINAIQPASIISPQGGRSVLDVIQRNVNAIRRVQGIPSINHPNFGWAITTEDLTRVENDRLLEVYNGHPQVNNLGGGGSPGLEQMWDAVLTSGHVIYGIAVDDAHHFKQWGPRHANPGRGWVAVRARTLSIDALRDALERGDFYASTGVTLSEITRLPDGVRLRIQPEAPMKYTIEFIGTSGQVLKTSFENPAAYTFAAVDRYVRARVISSGGEMAWTQPIFRE